MFLNLLTKEEKYCYLDLLTFLISPLGNLNEEGMKVFNRHRYETGEEGFRYRKSSQNAESLIGFFKDRSTYVKTIVFMNLVSASYDYEYYSLEEHDFIDKVREIFGISEKKRKEILKVIYSERDVKEKAKRLLSE